MFRIKKSTSIVLFSDTQWSVSRENSKAYTSWADLHYSSTEYDCEGYSMQQYSLKMLQQWAHTRFQCMTACGIYATCSNSFWNTYIHICTHICVHLFKIYLKVQPIFAVQLTIYKKTIETHISSLSTYDYYSWSIRKQRHRLLLHVKWGKVHYNLLTNSLIPISHFFFFFSKYWAIY